jgi:hypothetical protein
MSAAMRRTGRRAEADTAARQDANRLAALARDCETAGIRRRCLLLRLSCLPPELRKPHHVRLARDALDPLLSADRAHRFILPNHDIAVVWRGSAEMLLAAGQAAVTETFAGVEATMPPPEHFWRVLSLPEDADALRGLIQESLADAEPATRAFAGGIPLDAAALSSVETALSQADVARFARRRAVCRCGPDGRFQTAWELRTLSVTEVCAELAPGRAASGEPWLLRRLMRTLDRRLLVLLASIEELRAAGPFGLNLNVSSILGPDFVRFDAALPQSLRGRITLGVEPADILSDLAAFRFARDFARVRGYRLLLRLPDGSLLPALPPARLGVDLVEIAWSPALVALPTDLIEQEGGRMVLTGAASADALTWARAYDITLFEGRLVVPGQRAPGPAPAAAEPAV